MKHLANVIKIKNKPNAKKEVKTRYTDIFSPKKTYLCYKINGYWFRLNVTMWSDFTGVKYNTIFSRYSKNLSVEKCLSKKIDKYGKIKRNEK